MLFCIQNSRFIKKQKRVSFILTLQFTMLYAQCPLTLVGNPENKYIANDTCGIVCLISL